MAEKKINLNGQWQLLYSAPDGGEKQRFFATKTPWQKAIPVLVPGDIHPALHKADLIPDPYYGDNVKKCQWTTEKEWWFRKTFTINKEDLKTKTELVFDGIDTYGTVWLNGKKLGSTENMFLSYRFDVTDIIKPGQENNLVVKIGATMKIIEQFPYQKYFACFYTPRIFCRKTQCNFSWDWAPHLPALGIWQDVQLVTYDPGRIMNVAVRSSIRGDVSLFIELDQRKSRQDLDGRVSHRGELVTTGPTGKLRCEIWGQGEKTSQTIEVRGQKNHTTLWLRYPQLWWPNGYGEQPLYQYKVTWLKDGKKQHSIKGRFAIREVELEEHPRPEGGFSFRFVINGEPIFCKGANWVPLDCFPGTIKEDKYRYILQLVKDANFNMLRIWGGGIYEKDIFYELCDELGIMVWQDFMFACADYPDNEDWFVNLVIPEFRYQVKRLRNHPSLVYWCGGNEKTGSAGFKVHYGEKLFHTIIPGIVYDLDPTRPYKPASPYSLSDLGNDPDTGDTHGSCYEKIVIGNISKFRDYVAHIKTVFNSEFGFHGPARFRSFSKFVPEKNFWPPDDLWEIHVQDNPYNTLPETFVWVQKKIAEVLFGPINDVYTFIKYGMASHAEILREEMENHRRRKWINAGAMYWMLADCWPCASWASLDYYGEPKAIYYAMSRACQPIILSFRQYHKKIELYVCNDLLRGGTGNLEWGQMDLQGKSLWKKKKEIKVYSNVSQVVASFREQSLKKEKNSFLYARLTANNRDISTTFFPFLWLEVEWPEPELNWQIVSQQKKGKEWHSTLKITTHFYARMVQLTLPEEFMARYSDNYFDIMPNSDKDISIVSREKIKRSDLLILHWLDEWKQ